MLILSASTMLPASAVPLVFAPIGIAGTSTTATAGPFATFVAAQNYAPGDLVNFQASGTVGLSETPPEAGNGYTVNAAGVTVNALNTVGGVTSGPGTARQIPAASVPTVTPPAIGALAFSLNGGTFTQLLPLDASTGLGASIPVPTVLNFNTTVGAVFGGGLSIGDTIRFAVLDNDFANNNGQFTIAALAPPPPGAPELDPASGSVPAILAMLALTIVSRRRRPVLA